jgi:polysaccharide pyruvyl transferase WcaK-like protein
VRKEFAIVGGTLTGNRGAEAMVSTCVEQIRQRYPDAIIHILTYYPEADRNEQRPPGVYVHSATPLRLVTNWLPAALLGRALPFVKRRAHSDLAGLLGLLRVDALIDVAGVSFVDGREKFLPYNVLTLWPFLLNGVPVFKLSQAIGPITSLPNRVAARFVLPRIKLVVARGQKTAEHLEAWGLDRARLLPAPDMTFLLDPAGVPDHRDRPNRVGLIPSSLVQSKLPGHAALLAKTADALIDAGHEVVLIVHSYRSQSDKPRNNDLPTARKVVELSRHGQKLRIVGEGLDARGIKDEIGQCKAILTSRFHGMIAALSTRTPVLVVGWSHKYREVLKVFGLEDACFDYKKADADALIEKTLDTLRRGEEISAAIAARLPDMKAQSKLQFERMFEELV